MGYPLKVLMKNAARYAREDHWQLVDTNIIPRLAGYNAESVAPYVGTFLKSRNGNLRDLGGTIATNIKFARLPEKTRTKLRKDLKRELLSSDPNVFARFRSAVALVEHGAYDPQDKETIRSVFDDKEVQGDPDAKAVADIYKRKLR